MEDKRNQMNQTNLTDHYLSCQETHRLAANLNMVEAERERQKNPTKFDHFISVLVGVVTLPMILFIAYNMLAAEKSALAFIVFLICAIAVVYANIWFIVYSWKQMTK